MPKKKQQPAVALVEPVELLKLDLASGDRKREGFIGVDIADIPGVTDVILDLKQHPWPWPDNSVGEVNCQHFIEHLTGHERMAFMNELYRVLAVGATAFITGPYWSSMRAWQDPTHERPLSEADFLYYNKEWREKALLSHYPITCDFDFVYGYIPYPETAQRSQEWRDFAIKHYINVIADLNITLTKRAPS